MTIKWTIDNKTEHTIIIIHHLPKNNWQSLLLLRNGLVPYKNSKRDQVQCFWKKWHAGEEFTGFHKNLIVGCHLSNLSSRTKEAKSSMVFILRKWGTVRMHHVQGTPSNWQRWTVKDSIKRSGKIGQTIGIIHQEFQTAGINLSLVYCILQSTHMVKLFFLFL